MSKKIKRNDKIDLAVSIIMILFLFFIGYLRTTVPPPERPPETVGSADPITPTMDNVFTMDYVDDILKELNDDLNKELSFKEHQVSDVFVVNIPDSWIVLTSPSGNQKEALFIAYSSDVSLYASASISEIEVESFEEVVEMLQEEDFTVKVGEVKEEGSAVFVDIKAEGKSNSSVFWQRVVKIDNTFYLLSFISPLQETSSLTEIKNHFFDTVKIKK